MRFDIGNAVARTVRHYFTLFGVLFLAALVVNGILVLVTDSLPFEESSDLMDRFFASIVLLVASLVAASLIQALSMHAVGDIESGERNLGMADLFAKAGPVIVGVIGVSILTAIGVGIGFLLLVIPGIIALTWWAAAVPVVVVEDTGVVGAFGRSVQLVRGHAWSVFGYGLLMILILAAGGWVVDLVLLRLIDLDELIGGAFASIVTDSIMTPFAAVGYAVLYFELRRLENPQPLESDAWGAEGDAQ